MRKAAAHKPYRVWSWWQGAWWMVDHGDIRLDMVTSAERRTAYVTTHNPRYQRVINPFGRFVVTGPGQTPDDPDLP